MAAYRAAIVTAHVLRGTSMNADEWTEEQIAGAVIADLDEAAARVPADIRRLLWREAGKANPHIDIAQLAALTERLDALASQLEQKGLPMVDDELLRSMVAGAVADAMLEQRFHGLSEHSRRPWVEFIEQYRLSADIKPRTFSEYKIAYDDLFAITGRIPFCDITPVHVTDALKRRIARAKPRNERTVLAHDTQQKFITGISSLLSWAENHGLAKKKSNVAAGLKPIDVRKSEEAINEKRAFSPDELKTLYSAPIFSGCRSESYPYTPGNHKHKGNRVWMLLLALLGGWRVGELDVMTVADVHVDDGVMFLSLTERARQLIKDREVKTQSSPRRVVVHPIIRMYGFDDYVAHRRRSGPNAPLFTLKRSSNQLNRLIREAGVVDPQVTLHSLRHNFVQMVDESFPARIDKAFRDGLTGHSTNARGTYQGAMSPKEARTFIRGLLVPPTVAALVGWDGRIARERSRILGP